MSKATLTPRIKRSHAAELQYFQEQTGVPVQKCIDQALKHWLRDDAPVWLQEAARTRKVTKIASTRSHR